ncbi:MAG: hypothetical protein V1778_02585 [bacterium]
MIGCFRVLYTEGGIAMRMVFWILGFGLLCTAAGVSAQTPAPYDPRDWADSTSADRLYIGAFEMLREITSLSRSREVIWRKPDGKVIMVTPEMQAAEREGVNVQGWVRHSQFALRIGQWGEHLVKDLDAYLALDPPGKYTTAAQYLRRAIDDEYSSFFLLALERGHSRTWTKEDSMSYVHWIALDQRITAARLDTAGQSFRLATILRWAHEDGFISEEAYRLHLQHIR